MKRKVCSCGKVHYSLPKDAIPTEWGWQFNCECKSTCYVPKHWGRI